MLTIGLIIVLYVVYLIYKCCNLLSDDKIGDIPPDTMKKYTNIKEKIK